MGVKTFLLMAGGTGGHIFPALAVAAALRERGHKVVWLGSEGAMETRIVPQHGIEIGHRIECPAVADPVVELPAQHILVRVVIVVERGIG